MYNITRIYISFLPRTRLCMHVFPLFRFSLVSHSCINTHARTRARSLANGVNWNYKGVRGVDTFVSCDARVGHCDTELTMQLPFALAEGRGGDRERTPLSDAAAGQDE
jgi:hypothetical protein